MPPSFEWEIHDRAGPPSRIGVGSAPPGNRQRRFRSAIALIVLFIIGGVAIRAWTVVRDRTVREAQAELRASVELELASIAEADAELFRSRQDPADPGWQGQQLARHGFGIPGTEVVEFVPAPGLKPADRDPEISDIRVSGRDGRVQLTHWFEVRDLPPTAIERDVLDPDFDLPSKPLPFKSTWFYRQGEDGAWYHVAPSDSFLGIPHSWHSSRLEIRSAGLEASLLDNVAAELAGLVLQVCQGLDCPPNTHYVLSFEDIPTAVTQGDRWTIPAPHLAGMPEEEEARAAWRWLLKLWLFQNLVADHSNVDEIADKIILRQLVGRLAAQVGLAESLSVNKELLAQAGTRNQLHSLQSLWQARVNAEAPQEMRLLEAEITALLDFLTYQMGSDRLYELLPAPGEPFRAARAALFSSLGLELEGFTAAWSEYVSELSGEPLTSLGGSPDAPPIDESLTLSPVTSSRQIALVFNDRIWVGSVDGSDVMPLTQDGQRINLPTWSPDGRRLLTPMVTEWD